VVAGLRVNSEVGELFGSGYAGLGKRLQKYWKIGIYWLTTVRNVLLEPFTPEISTIIWYKQ
jgi:hypothetical protein